MLATTISEALANKGYLTIGLNDSNSDSNYVYYPAIVPGTDTIAKGFDTFAPISDVVLKDKIPNPNNLDLSLKVSREIRQNSNTKYMIYSVERIIEFISGIMTLEEGDLIMTGTPEGVGEIVAGDELEAKLGDFCFLKVNVR